MTHGQNNPVEGGDHQESKTEKVEKRAEKSLRSDVGADDLKGFVENINKDARGLKELREQGVRTKTHSVFGTPEIPGLIPGGGPSPATVTEQQIKDMTQASDQGMMIGAGGKFVQGAEAQKTAPDGMTEAEFNGAVKQFMAENPQQEKPVAVIAENPDIGNSRQFKSDATNAMVRPSDASYNDHLAYLEKRSENYHRDIAQQLKDAMHSYSVSDMFDRGTGTAISDVYQHSKNLKEGDPGKSEALENAVGRLKDCPWTDKIKIKFDGSITNPDYNEQTSTITINPNDSVAKQIETFVHESYHATHQSLTELYGGSKAVSMKDFVRIMGDHEARSFEAEIKVHDELSSKLPGAVPVGYEWKDKHEVTQPTKDLGELYHSKGLPGLRDFIVDEARTRMDINGHKQLATYKEYYESKYGEYQKTFDAGHKQYDEQYAKDPDVKQKIETGDY